MEIVSDNELPENHGVVWSVSEFPFQNHSTSFHQNDQSSKIALGYLTVHTGHSGKKGQNLWSNL